VLSRNGLRWSGILLVVGVAAFVGIGAWEWPWLNAHLLAGRTQPEVDPPEEPSAGLVPGQPNAIRLPAKLAGRLGIETIAVQPGTQPVVLELAGTLALDANRLSHVHARFAAEMVQMGMVGPEPRAIDYEDLARQGQLLAVIWSRKLDEKKSELVDALSQLRPDRETLDRLRRASADGAIPNRTLREAERKVEADRMAVSRVERTLQTWRVTPEEIAALRAEAERLATTDTPTREQMVEQWARLEVRAPLDGTILERNIALRDLVDTNLDLFKIGDLTRLRVMAQAYEEDLPALDALPEDQRPWMVEVPSDPKGPARPGRFEQIGHVIDPNQHTALVTGGVDNLRGHLRVGQFDTSTIDFLPSR
jgi:cobalt-zinc-cadmium efflux system membrane fusion protein